MGTREHLLDTMEEILLRWNRLLKIDRSRKHANEAHVYSAFGWEILRNRMFRSILDLMCVAWFSFQVDAFCLAIELLVRMDLKCHSNPLPVNLYPILRRFSSFYSVRFVESIEMSLVAGAENPIVIGRENEKKKEEKKRTAPKWGKKNNWKRREEKNKSETNEI